MNPGLQVLSAEFAPASTRQRGAQLVELALMLPVILTVVFAIVGYSLLFLVQHSLSSAVSQGARAVSVASSTANPETAARQLLLNSLPAAFYPAGFSFSSQQLGGAAACGNALGTGGNPTLSCLEFRGFFNIAENPFLASIPFSDTLFPAQLSATAVVLYQNTNAI
ncbi:MAG TPA: TadE family protein [Limnobacter sp.]|nr:TadE family protein [Limnobacter sp.]